MFIGQYHHRLEGKGRVSVPREFRKKLGEKGVITRGLDGCLFLFPQDKWQELAVKLKETPLTSLDARAFSRLLSYGGFEVSIDKQGRILIPEILRKFAKLREKVIVAGSLDRIEIWDEETFEVYQQKIEKTSDEIAERISKLEIRI